MLLVGKSARGDIERPMGPVQHADGGDRRPHVQRDGVHGDHADDLEEAQRPRQELEARVQGAGAHGVPHQDRQREGRHAVQGEHLRHPHAAGLPVHGGGQGPRCDSHTTHARYFIIFM